MGKERAKDETRQLGSNGEAAKRQLRKAPHIVRRGIAFCGVSDQQLANAGFSSVRELDAFGFVVPFLWGLLLSVSPTVVVPRIHAVCGVVCQSVSRHFGSVDLWSI